LPSFTVDGTAHYPYGAPIDREAAFQYAGPVHGGARYGSTGGSRNFLRK
jgi:hypothetical protein